jgi:hypothetical protein
MSNTIDEISIRYLLQQNFAWEKFAGIYSGEQEMIHPSAITNEQTPTGNVTWVRPRYSQMTRGLIQSTG